jgi:hypothetical protein
MRSCPNRRRRGVLLLVVLGLLSMFAMIGLTFVVLTGQERRIAEIGQTLELQYVPPQSDLDRAMAQVARGSTSPMSAIGPHSLLEDMYGPIYAQSTISSVNQLTTVPTASGTTGGLILEIATTIANAERYSGSVLTMLTGPAAGTSARIIGYQVSGGRSARFQVLPTGNIDYNTLANYLRSYGSITYIVNGMPFSGKGFGDYNNGRLSDLALQPGAHRFGYLPNGGTGTSAGEANEDYDAADHQNMLLAMVKGPIYPTGSASANDDTIRVPIPSLHRPDLANYWATNRRQTDAVSAMRYILRPLQRTPDSTSNSPSIHRAFTGSNRGTFNPLWDGTYANSNGGNYCWDVDNDGDGVADSIWVDLGMQVRSTADGRLYKPLFAILCTDLDGRINLNAHGCPAQASSSYYVNATTGNTWVANTALRNSTQRYFASGVLATSLQFPSQANYNGVSSLPLWRGLGLGPAEINLRALFDSAAPAASTIPNELLYLFRGRRLDAVRTYEGRYGETVGASTDLPGLASFRASYPPNVYTLLNNRETAYAKNYYGTDDAYGTPPDLDGHAAIALDVAGRPVYWGMGEAEPARTTHGSNHYYNGNYTRNTPYELNLAGEAAWRRDVDTNYTRTIDNPFTPAELERVLRAFDVDSASLPLRLLALTASSSGSTTDSLLLRRAAEITTESWDLPCPAVVLPPELRGTATGPAYHLLYLLQLKTSRAGSARSGSNLVSLARTLFAPEWLAGLRMDLNRPFGNGRDGNNNSVVDEAEEVSTEKLVTYNGLSTITCDPSNGNYNNFASGATRARQFYARNLYCLALLLLDMENTWDEDKSIGKPRARRRLAQWAVNVVDFYDRDSIMTRFPFDCNPFDSDGWTSITNDDDPTKGGIVWGVERPELLLTETLAFHDRRTEDTAEDEPDKKTVADGDPNFDQRLRPQGSLFLELFNPWNVDDRWSGDIHRSKSSTLPSHPLVGAVNLAQRTPAVGGVDYPVWQILITNRTMKADDIDYPQTATSTTTGTAEVTTTADRAIYFTDPSALPKTADLNAKVRYYPAAATEKLLTSSTRYIGPGEYAVVGPGDENEVTASHTYLGFETGKDEGLSSTRQIVLNMDVTNAKQSPVEIIGNNRSTPDVEKIIRPPIAVIINRSDPAPHGMHQRMSISEPIGGYAEDATNAPAYTSGRYVYSPVVANPVDLNRADGDGNMMRSAIQNNGSSTPLRMIHLRRLANPLKPYSNDERKPEEQNVYRTIDSMPVDLTAFNGAADYNAAELGEGVTVKPVAMDSRERGDNANKNADPYDLWAQEGYNTTNVESKSIPAPPADHYYNKAFSHTLGYLNRCYGDLTGDNAPATRTSAHRGDPIRPFPWFTWNNRPFFSPYELMLVPWNNSATLLNRDTDAYYGQTVSGLNYYAGGTNTPYRHLWNYFQSMAYPRSATTTVNPFPQFFRILDMVQVPSRFVGTQIQLTPTTMASTGNVEHYFHPPFHWVSTYREPGRVNINTVYNYDVFRAVMNYSGAVVNSPAIPQSDMLLLWDKLVRSRRGDASAAATTSTTPTNTFLNTVNASMLKLNSAMPTRFGNPFRSYAGGHLRHNTQQSAMSNMGLDAEIHATLLRADPDVRTRPLFEYRSTQPHEEANRNPFFRYRNFERFGNLLTTRSNVYAIWITVGYFEVRRNSGTAYPDGYELGQELGVDTGEMQRHRAFYIFDRSIPVGFIRGRDLNFEKALLIRRYIE